MCGTVGLFVGCAAVTFCPLRMLGGGEPGFGTGGPDHGYAARSPLRSWHERASVRSAPRRIFDDDRTGQGLFPRELVPVANHPLVGLRPPAVSELIVATQLFRYLDFTAKLELLVVNRTMLGLASGSIKLDMPGEMRFDGLKMYCDEAYHALQAVDLMRQISAGTGITPRLPDEPFFLTRLQEILAALPPDRRMLAELLFVIVSETLISATLADVLGEGQVNSAVLDTIRDHAADEGRHHAYFAGLLPILWAELTPKQRDEAGRLVPSLIDAFLRPDLHGLRQELAGYDFSDDEIEVILGETYQEKKVHEYARSASRHTRRYFAELGAFDSAAARDELERSGLADPA